MGGEEGGEEGRNPQKPQPCQETAGQKQQLLHPPRWGTLGSWLALHLSHITPSKTLQEPPVVHRWVPRPPTQGRAGGVSSCPLPGLLPATLGALAGTAWGAGGPPTHLQAFAGLFPPTYCASELLPGPPCPSQHPLCLVRAPAYLDCGLPHVSLGPRLGLLGAVTAQPRTQLSTCLFND